MQEHDELISMLPKEFQCKQCGNCCQNLSGAFDTCADEDDIEQWKNEGRDDILEWVLFIPLGPDSYIADLWFNPKTGDEAERCPWLRKLPRKNKYICRIHDVKPKHCREYPKSREHAEETGCKGFMPPK
jgi:Fe-S-cluster containining protein